MTTPLCALVRPELKAFADGELPLLARLRVARHLKTCPDCPKELIQMQTLSEELKPSEVETSLEPELRAKILASAPVVSPAQSTETQRKRRRVARKKTVLALGAASLAGGLLWVGAQNGGFTAPQPDVATSDATPDAAPPPPIAPSPMSSASSGNSSSAVTDRKPNAARAESNAARAESNAESDTISSTAIVTQTPARRGAASSLQQASRAVFADGHVRSFAAEGAKQRFAPRPALPGSVDAGVSAGAALSAGAASSAGSADVNGNGAYSVVPASRVVHREGSVAVAVDNAEQSSDDARTLVKNAGGFVAQTALETGANHRRTATLDCRVPAGNFEAVVSKIGLLGTVTAKSLNGQDITAQIAQSGAKRQAWQQELSIAQARLAQKEKTAKKREADQVFALRFDVRAVRLQAAQARAQLETLEKYGNTSELFVSLQDRAPVNAASAGLTDSLGPNGSAAWNSFLRNARVPFQLLLLVAAYIPIWLPALLLWRKFGRKWLAE